MDYCLRIVILIRNWIGNSRSYAKIELHWQREKQTNAINEAERRTYTWMILSAYPHTSKANKFNKFVEVILICSSKTRTLHLT